jgi:hypothetical protein
MDQWAIHGSERGQSFGVGDLLIGAMAQEAGALIWSLDSDFQRMARLKFVDLLRAVAASLSKRGSTMRLRIALPILAASLVTAGIATVRAQQVNPSLFGELHWRNVGPRGPVTCRRRRVCRATRPPITPGCPKAECGKRLMAD